MNNPLISIIIPTYNRAHLIKETLDSIFTQTYPVWECIIVDDGSTDNTVEVVNEYVKKDSRFRFCERPSHQPKGGNAARNYGFELSKGDYVNWFDDDDVLLQDFLKNKIDLLRPELEFLICSGYLVDQNLQNQVLMKVNNTDNLFKEYVLWNQEIITNSVLIKRTFLLDKELFLNFIIRGQETEFFSRLFFNISPKKYKITDIPLFLYRQHDDTKSKRNNQYVKIYKKSQTYIALENFKRSIILNDKDLIQYYYKGILDYFFRALENNDAENANYILKEFIPILKKINYLIALEFTFFGRFFYFISRGSYRIEKYFKLKKIQ